MGDTGRPKARRAYGRIMADAKEKETMTEQDLNRLRVAIVSLADPAGNWSFGWNMICDLAQLNPKHYPAPFRHRSDKELGRLAKTRLRKSN
jgi:hypothetical protein